MFRLIRFLFSLALLLGLIGFVGWQILPTVCEKALENHLGLDVSIGDIPFRLRQPITFYDVKIANPKEYNLLGDNALEAKVLEITFDLPTLFSKKIIIKNITLTDADLTLQIDNNLRYGNWIKIAENITTQTDLNEKAGAAGSNDSEVFIKKLIIKDIDTSFLLGKDPSKTYNLPNIKELALSNLSSDKGAPIDQILTTVLGKMLVRVAIDAHIGNIFDSAFPFPGIMDHLFKKAGATIQGIGKILTKPFKPKADEDAAR